MRYVSINSFLNGSTGSIMRQITEERLHAGDECWMVWGRGRAAEGDHEYKLASQSDVLFDVIQTRFDGKTSFHSRRPTGRLLDWLDEKRPDLVHLHNLHGYYLNVDMLFQWLADHDSVQVKWTLHDCWAFTGHCAYFTDVGCSQWIHGCAEKEGCPQLTTYPKTFAGSASCAWCYQHKRECFTRLPPSRMTLVTPSHWLEGLVKESFLSKYPIEVRYNTVDTDIFKPTPGNFRERFGIGNRFMILGVASEWTKRKGLPYFERLAKELDDQYVVVLVGLNNAQTKRVNRRIIALGRTDSAEELAEIYTAADVHVQPSVEETFGLTVAEAQACGTPVIVMEGSACEEVGKEGLTITARPCFDSLKKKIIEMRTKSRI